MCTIDMFTTIPLLKLSMPLTKWVVAVSGCCNRDLFPRLQKGHTANAKQIRTWSLLGRKDDTGVMFKSELLKAVC